MEIQEEANGNSESMHVIAKGKRTKRPRVLLLPAPPPAAAASSSTSSAEFSGSTTDEEDMANCLILLAQGRARNPEPESPMEEGGNGGVGTEKFTSRRYAEAATTNGKAGFYVYECKTCNKCFPSFQALGGHRASHKKPRMVNPISMVSHERRDMEDDDGLQISLNSFSKPVVSLAINNGNSKPKVHECSICGAEFSSGQALGGHMRRHRPLSLPEPPAEDKKERNVLSLDLNLPAPSDDDRAEFPRSPFVGKQPLLFSASALVDCHY